MELNKIYNIACKEGLQQLEDNSINTLICSPPYFGLRDYQLPSWEGGYSSCNHEAARIKTRFDYPLSEKQSSNKGSDVKQYQEICPDCGAKQTPQLGLESTPEQFVSNLCDIFDEVKRVLRDDGTCFVNLGDTYLGSGKGVWKGRTKANKESFQFQAKPRELLGGWRKQKQLAMVPARFAIEMQNRGWILRNRLIWWKPNAMPTSATDRFSVDYEEVFFFVKNKKYYFEQQFEPHKQLDKSNPNWRPSQQERFDNQERFEGEGKHGKKAFQSFGQLGRNKRSVWAINTKPFKGAHFAVFPPALIEPLIKAGCPRNVCAKCGRPLIQKPGEVLSIGCNCNAEFKPGVVCDIFGGAGTSALVSKKLGRDFILFELNSDYCNIARKRLENESYQVKSKPKKRVIAPQLEFPFEC